MPSKKKKYNARFPPARIKKIMQTDEEIGKVAQAVPVIISRALELFVEALLRQAAEVTKARNAKTLTPAHLKQCIVSENRFDFLKDLVSAVPDVQNEGDETPSTPGPDGSKMWKAARRPRKQSSSTSRAGEEAFEDDDEADEPATTSAAPPFPRLRIAPSTVSTPPTSAASALPKFYRELNPETSEAGQSGASWSVPSAIPPQPSEQYASAVPAFQIQMLPEGLQQPRPDEQ